MYQEDFHLSHHRQFPPPPRIAAATHGKRTKASISSNQQSLSAQMTFELSKWKTTPVKKYTK